MPGPTEPYPADVRAIRGNLPVLEVAPQIPSFPAQFDDRPSRAAPRHSAPEATAVKYASLNRIVFLPLPPSASCPGPSSAGGAYSLEPYNRVRLNPVQRLRSERRDKCW